MKLSSNRTKILQCLYPGKKGHDFSLSGPDLRTRSGLEPLKFRTEIRALINLGCVHSRSYLYRITAAGKAALMKARGKESYGDGEMKELFK